MSKEEKYSKNFIAGGIAGVFAKTIVAPIDRIKIFYLVWVLWFRFVQRNLNINMCFKMFKTYIIKKASNNFGEEIFLM